MLTFLLNGRCQLINRQKLHNWNIYRLKTEKTQ